MYSYGSPHTAAQKQDDQHERTFSSYVRIQVVVLKTYLGRWTIGRSGERGSGISVLPARYDDDEKALVQYIQGRIKKIRNSEENRQSRIALQMLNELRRRKSIVRALQNPAKKKEYKSRKSIFRNSLETPLNSLINLPKNKYKPTRQLTCWNKN